MIPRMLPQGPGPCSPDYTAEEWRAWQWLRHCFLQGRDLWSDRELAHLRFLRWLAESGQLAEAGGPTRNRAAPRGA